MKNTQIIEQLKKANHVLLSGHVSPDSDAIGSLVAMASLLVFLGKKYTILLDDMPKKYSYLVEGFIVAPHFDGDYDAFVALDCGDQKRLGKYEAYFEQAKTTFNIDHHHTNNEFGRYNYVDKEASSTSELVFELIQAAHMPLTKEVAIAIYSGIVFDTGGFMHSCTHPSTHLIAAKLLEMPFNAPKIHHHIVHLRTKGTCILQGILMQRAKWIGIDKVFSYITQKDIEENECTVEDVDGVVNYLKNIEGVNVAAVLYPASLEKCKLSLRSNPPYDVSKFASKFGGGGHQRASGATLEGNLERWIDELASAIEGFIE
jgi:phosphoesterase RecJ-like protein